MADLATVAAGFTTQRCEYVKTLVLILIPNELNQEGF
jgi:hypothetical protein